MPSQRKFFVTKVTVTVLSEDKIHSDVSLGTISNKILFGEWSGAMETHSTEVSGAEMAKLLQKQGSDPEFFGIDKDGNEVRDGA